VNAEQNQNPFASPRPTAVTIESGGNRQNRSKLLLLSIIVGVMHGGTVGALSGATFAICSAVAYGQYIGIIMFLYLVIAVFYSFFVGGLAGSLNGIVNCFTNLKSRWYIGLNCLIASAAALLPVFLLTDFHIKLLCLLTAPATAIFITRHLYRLFDVYNRAANEPSISA